MAAKNFKQTRAFKLAYEQAMEIFKITKEEKYSLTDPADAPQEVYAQTS
jgi:hypothetical protein